MIEAEVKSLISCGQPGRAFDLAREHLDKGTPKLSAPGTGVFVSWLAVDTIEFGVVRYRKFAESRGFGSNSKGGLIVDTSWGSPVGIGAFFARAGVFLGAVSRTGSAGPSQAGHSCHGIG